MSQPADPFTRSFDSIEVEQSALSRDAFDRAMAPYGPRVAMRKPEQPGFYLLDDADGRFVVDRDMGVITLASDAYLESERGAVHEARLRVVEQSGASYELPLKLRISGHVPSMVGAEEFEFGAAPAVGAPARRVALRAAETPAPQLGWTGFAASRYRPGKASLPATDAAFAAVLEQAPLPAAPGPFRLHLFTPLPAAAAADADWSL